MTNFFGKSKKTLVKRNVSDINHELYVFILKNIDMSRIDKDYATFEDIVYTPISHSRRKITKENKIGETSIDKIRVSSFTKEPIITVVSKQKLLFYVPLIDHVKKSRLPTSTSIPCAGCRRKYTTCPLGIPIKYHPSVYRVTTTNNEGKIIHEHNQLVNANERKQIEKLMNEKKDGVEPFKNSKGLLRNCEIIENEYFDTDAMVCSFNCMLLTIEENSSLLYKNSEMLMYKLYYMIFGHMPASKIIKAPSWRLRKEYDGPLLDEEYEKCLQTIEFVDTHQTLPLGSNSVNEIGDKLKVKVSKKIKNSSMSSDDLKKMMKPAARMIEVKELD